MFNQAGVLRLAHSIFYAKWGFLRFTSRDRTWHIREEKYIQQEHITTKNVKGCDGGNVLTDYVLGIYKHWFEESAKTTTLEIYNVSSRGSYIENVKNIGVEEAKQLLSAKENHNYPWNNNPAWQGEPKEILSSEILKKEFLNDLNNLSSYLDEISLDNSEIILEQIKEKINQIHYLKQMIRKTEIYLRRHEKDLNEVRQREILLNSLKKEIRFLKKGILIS